MRRVWLLLRKDLLVLRRSPALLAILLAYPIVIALLIGTIAGYANAKPRVAFVDQDNLPDKAIVAGERIDIDEVLARIDDEVKLVEMSDDEARDQLESGRIVASITIPRGFLDTLRGLVTSPTLILQTGTGGITPRVRQQMQALVYNLNLLLQKTFIEADIEYVNLLIHGGEGEVLGRGFSVIGLDGAAERIERLPPSQEKDDLAEFVDDARQALELTDDAIRATATPIVLVEQTNGRTSALSAQVQAYGLALTITFLALLLAAGALAAERDENVIGRLSRGLVSLGELVVAKVALAAALALGIGVTIALVFGVAVEIGDVAGGEPWERLPLLFAAILLSGAVVGAIGAVIGGFAREARTASLAGVLFVLPVVFLGLVPREVVPAAGWVSDAFPFAHSVRLFASALYDAEPWRAVLRESLWLVGLGCAFGALARLGAKRLAA